MTTRPPRQRRCRCGGWMAPQRRRVPACRGNGKRDRTVREIVQVTNSYAGAAASGVAVWARIAAGPVRTSLINSDCLEVSVLRKICFS